MKRKLGNCTQRVLITALKVLLEDSKIIKDSVGEKKKKKQSKANLSGFLSFFCPVAVEYKL